LNFNIFFDFKFDFWFYFYFYLFLNYFYFIFRILHCLFLYLFTFVSLSCRMSGRLQNIGLEHVTSIWVIIQGKLSVKYLWSYSWNVLDDDAYLWSSGKWIVPKCIYLRHTCQNEAIYQVYSVVVRFTQKFIVSSQSIVPVWTFVA